MSCNKLTGKQEEEYLQTFGLNPLSSPEVGTLTNQKAQFTSEVNFKTVRNGIAS